MDIESRVLDTASEIQNLIILLARANNSPIRGKLWLQKELFLLSDRLEEIREQSGYEPYLLGPHSDTVAEELSQLEDIGVISFDANKIYLTNFGQEVAKKLEKTVGNKNPQLIDLIREYKEFLNDMTSDELLCYVYSAYPDMTEESVEYHNLKPKMENTILRLVEKNKISASRAAELLKKNKSDVIKMLNKRGIQVIS